MTAIAANLGKSTFSITPNDTEPLSKAAYGLWIGGAGNVRVVYTNGVEDTCWCAAGTVFPFPVAKVLDTNTTATDIHGIKKD